MKQCMSKTKVIFNVFINFLLQVITFLFEFFYSISLKMKQGDTQYMFLISDSFSNHLKKKKKKKQCTSDSHCCYDTKYTDEHALTPSCKSSYNKKHNKIISFVTPKDFPCER